MTPTIGLEVHAELRTRTKMFCACANNPDEERENVNVCPVCLAHPGTLPVINRQAVEHILRMGAAVGGRIANGSEFDRKSYFYPDIPKGYQISQYPYPLVAGGKLANVALTRIHLEEDTARSTHTREGTLVDFNRAGVPLMELVTEPVIHEAETAGRFARELQLLLRTLGVGAANLEKGEMRVEANVSVSSDPKVFGTKVEIKNLNSFRSVERAIGYEIQRQSELLEKGEPIRQETRGWDESRQATFSQRPKEGSADYRYFPEPDLPPLTLSEFPKFMPDALQRTLPELPWDRRTRYANTFKLKAETITYIVNDPTRSAFFDTVVSHLANDVPLIVRAANYLISDVAGIFTLRGSEAYKTINAAAFAKLIRMTADRTLSSRGAKDTLALLIEHGGDPEELARNAGLLQIHNIGTLSAAVATVVSTEAAAVEEYKGGKESALEYLVGKAMKATKSAGNPVEIRRLLREELRH